MEDYIKSLLERIADVETIFDNICYVIIGSDIQSPIDDLNPEEQEILLDWIEINLHSPFIYNYHLL